ncbi:hypothetical protein [Metabacillus indicus]|uniref:hypothetical protein n=1 Tax=Metabacillus indicus TaxID=246786 RepID=UPI0004932FB2|nr:hypothetical protein [Metabacillus indicus]KEZ47740.1 hypothetical protein AZ46_0220310 [Metabacillus indicus LMG 22858]
MKKIHFNLFGDYYDFEKNKLINQEIILQKNFDSEFFSKSDLEELFNQIIAIKLDGLKYEINESMNVVYASISLLLSFPKVEIDDQLIKILKVVNNFNYKENINQSTNNSFVEFAEHKGEEGLLLRIRDLYDFEENIVFNELRKLKLEYEVVSRNARRMEKGSSDIFSEIIVFILNSAASGYTWDKLKSKIKKIEPKSYNYDLIENRNIEMLNYKQMLENVGEMININPNELGLRYMYKDNEACIFEFLSNRSIITVTSDQDHFIKEISVKEINKADEIN